MNKAGQLPAGDGDMSDIKSRALAAALIREQEANRDWSKAAREHRKHIDDLKEENVRLSEMVSRMYLHCTSERGEMTQAESDEWMTQAARLGSVNEDE